MEEGTLYVRWDVDKLKRLEKENKKLKRRLAAIQKVVNEQAEDEGLWFDAKTTTEVYLQLELRRLHRVIEEEK